MRPYLRFTGLRLKIIAIHRGRRRRSSAQSIGLQGSCMP